MGIEVLGIQVGIISKGVLSKEAGRPGIHPCGHGLFV
jgi:hypothetical protein